MRTFDDIIVEVVLLFAIIIASSIGILRIFRIKKYAISLAMAHIIFILSFSMIYFSSSKHDAMAAMVWGIPLFLDLPCMVKKFIREKMTVGKGWNEGKRDGNSSVKMTGQVSRNSFQGKNSSKE